MVDIIVDMITSIDELFYFKRLDFYLARLSVQARHSQALLIWSWYPLRILLSSVALLSPARGIACHRLALH